MKCNICEYENIDNAKYCSRCGNQIKFVEEEHSTLMKKCDSTKDYDKFAKIGMSLGITGLILCFTLGLGCFFSIPGIVFSAVGRRSVNCYFKAQKGVIISIIATVLNFALMYVLIYFLRYLINLAGKDYLYYSNN